MKKLFIAALLTVTLAASAFAADNNKVNGFALKNFSSQFSNASNVSWVSTENYVKAAFISNNEKMEAFYDYRGELIGTSKAVNADVLPTNAKRTLGKKYGSYTVKEVIQFDGTDESAYFISLENEADSLILKVAQNNQISTVKRTRK